MKTSVIAGAVILGLGAVTFAVARQDGRPPATSGPAAPPPADGHRLDRAELHDRVARLRAEVELLQLEHDLVRNRLVSRLTERAGRPSPELGREYMKVGAEIVGKADEFEAAMRERGADIWKAVEKAISPTPPADIDRLKQDFLRVATDLNRKKIDLVEQEVQLDSSM